MGLLEGRKQAPRSHRRNTIKNKPRSKGGDFRLNQARLSYEKSSQYQINTLWVRLTRASHGRRFRHRIRPRHPRINDSTQSRLDILNTPSEDTSKLGGVGLPLTYSNVRPQLTLASLPREEPKATEIPEPTKELWGKLPSSLGFGEGVSKGLTATERQKLIDHLVEQFWVMYDAESAPHGKLAPKDASGESMQDRDGFSQSGTSISSTSTLDKQKKEDEPESDDDVPRRRPGKVRPSFVEATRNSFACPYRKYDPHKYNVIEWRSCGIAPFRTISHVKEHLYRKHRTIQCPHCKSIFKTRTEQETHLGRPTICTQSPEPMISGISGITNDIERQLRGRNRIPGQTGESRWGNIWKILFPSDPVPSPYFEPPGTEAFKSGSDDRAVENFENYVRRQLPAIFQSILEAATNNHLQPIEDVVKGQLSSLITDAQEQVFAQYHEAHPQPERLYSSLPYTINPISTGQTNRRSISAPSSQGLQKSVVQDSMSSLEIDFGDFENTTFGWRETEYAESGHGSISWPIFHEHEDKEPVLDKRIIPLGGRPGEIQDAGSISWPILQEHEDKKPVLDQRIIRWDGRLGTIQDAIYPPYRAVEANVSTQWQRASVLFQESSLIKSNLLDRVMNEFWSTIFDREWLYSFRVHGQSSNPKSGEKQNKNSKSSKSNAPVSKNNKEGNKRMRRSAEEEEDDDEETEPKEVILDLDDVEDPDLGLGFACHYRKNSPTKYNVTDWAPCTLTPRRTIARIKAHLYDYHFIHQCQRCNGIYDTEILLNDHINAVQACSFIESQQGGRNGINRSLKDLIASRKRLFPGQSERQKWEHIYQLIFPGEPLPISPYWDNPNQQERLFVDRYNEYLVQELPRTVRRGLERLVAYESNPNERIILEQAVSLLPAALNIVWHTFRGTFDPNPHRDDIFPHPSARTSTSNIESNILGMSQESLIPATSIQPTVVTLQTQLIPAASRLTSHVTFSSDSAYFSGDSNAADGPSNFSSGDMDGDGGVETNDYDYNVPRQPNIPVRSEAEIQGSQIPGTGPSRNTEDRNPAEPQPELLPALPSELASLQSGQALPELFSQLTDGFMGQDPTLNPIDWDSANWDPLMDA